MNIVTVKKVRTLAKVELGLRIRHCRLRCRDFAGRPMTQAELARRLGMNYSTVSLWESGLGAPSAIVLHRLLGVLGVTPDEFFAIKIRIPRAVRAELRAAA